MSPSAHFARALLLMEGVGRVSAGRLMKHFPTLEALRACPREQVLLRLKSAPHAEATVARLFDEEAMADVLERSRRELEMVASRRVAALCLHDAAFPPALSDLPASDRPVLLYCYGDTACLQRPTVAFFAQPPVSEPVYESAQMLLNKVIAAGGVPVTGASTGFDVALQKIVVQTQPSARSAMVVGSGLAYLPTSMRPTASALVKAGGALVSPFEMNHRPFSHDERESAMVQAALAHVLVFVEPEPHTPAWAAMTWALEAKRAVFAFPRENGDLPEAVHRLATPTDLDWVTAAVQAPPS